MKLTPAVVAAIVEATKKGLPRTTAARLAGVSTTQLRVWLTIGSGGAASWPDGSTVEPETLTMLQDFAAKMKDAEAEFEAAMVEALLEASKTVGKSGVREWRAAAWLLERSPATRENWVPHREMTVDQHVTLHPAVREIRQLSDEELLERVEQLAIVPGSARALPPAAEGGIYGDTD